VALIRQFKEISKATNRVHENVECGWTTFVSEGETYLQLDTYGRAGRQIPGKVSQSIQLNADSAPELLSLIKRAFPRAS
jgi:hypothetical protein